MFEVNAWELIFDEKNACLIPRIVIKNSTISKNNGQREYNKLGSKKILSHVCMWTFIKSISLVRKIFHWEIYISLTCIPKLEDRRIFAKWMGLICALQVIGLFLFFLYFFFCISEVCTGTPLQVIYGGCSSLFMADEKQT